MDTFREDQVTSKGSAPSSSREDQVASEGSAPSSSREDQVASEDSAPSSSREDQVASEDSAPSSSREDQVASEDSAPSSSREDQVASKGSAPSSSREDQVASEGSAPSSSRGDQVASEDSAPSSSREDQVASKGSAPSSSREDQVASEGSAPSSSREDQVASEGSAPSFSREDQVASEDSAPSSSREDQVASKGRAPSSSREDQVASEDSAPSSSREDQVASKGSAPSSSCEDQVAFEGSAPASSREDQVASKGSAPSSSREDQVASEGSAPSSSREDQVAFEDSAPSSSLEDQVASKGSAPSSSREDQVASKGSAPSSSREDQVASEDSAPSSSREDQVASEGSAPSSSREDQVASEGSAPSSSREDQVASEGSVPSSSREDQVASEGSAPSSSLEDQVASEGSAPSSSREGQVASEGSAPSLSDLALLQDGAENDEADSRAKKVTEKARTILVRYMNPVPIFDCAFDLFNFELIRDMKEKENTSEKNRSLCDNVRRRGRLGYGKLKEWLRKTHQKELAQVLECIEDERDYTELLETVHQEMINKMEQERGVTIQQKTDKEYDVMKSNLQNDLISMYRRRHKKIPLSPLMKEDPPLLKFYVMPDILTVKVTRSRDGDKEEKTPVRTLRDVFYKDDKICSNIYLTADAGMGKTAFGKRLALAWCHAKKPDKNEDRHFSEDELTDLSGFGFLFLVLLRDSSSECDMDMLILNQICSQLPRDYNLENLRNILFEETCLVVLDGLDEWTHPSKSCIQGESNIPHQRVRENVAVLTTTRPWKLSVSGLHSSQMEQKLELTGLSNDSAKILKRSVISEMYGEQDDSKLDKYEDEFNIIVEEHGKSGLTSIPLFLMYFLFLWYYKFNIGKSLADLYRSITELLLSRTAKTDRIHAQNVENIHGNFPPSFDGTKLCKQFYTLLTTLGKLAFQTLFNETKENTLVFDGCIAEQFLSKEDFTFCLKTGIITQSKIQGASLLEQNTKVSFAHKTVQEFLAALYINSAPDLEKVLSKCKCVKDILDMSKIFMFIVGINSKSTFSRELMKIINEDRITMEYRSSLKRVLVHQFEDLQDMFVSCCKDIPREIDASLCFQDVFINRRCVQEDYCENLKQLTSRNKKNIRSLHINISQMKNTPYDTARKVIDYFELRDLENVEKVHYKGDYTDDDILPLLNSSVKCLSLSCNMLLPSSWSGLLFDKLTSLHKLKAIRIGGYKMSHSELSLLLGYVSQREGMKEINLVDLECTDHMSSCSGLSVDLSRHQTLRKLTLYWLNLSKVVVNMASLEQCYLYLDYQDLVLRFLDCADNSLNTFNCWGLQSSTAIDVVLDTLRSSRHIRHVKLEDINLGTRNLTFTPEFVNIKSLELESVTMEASTFSELVDSFLKLPQTVRVHTVYCATSISPEEEFKTVKEKIKSSHLFRVLGGDENFFVFETIKDGD